MLESWLSNPMKLLLIARFAVPLLFASSTSFGTQCNEEKASANLTRFASVFSGRVVEVDSFLGNSYAKFQIDRVWKGAMVKEAQLLIPIRSDVSKPLSFKEGESYLVYALTSDDEGIYSTSECTRTRKLADAKEDLDVLGEGLSPDVAPPAVPRFDIPVVIENEHVLRFPSSYTVTLMAHTAPGYTIVVFGYLDVAVTSLKNLERVSPKDKRIYVGLKDGQTATFITPNVAQARFFDLEIPSVKIQNTPLETLQDPGDIKSGDLSSFSNKYGEPISAQLSALPRDSSLTISWRKTSDH